MYKLLSFQYLPTVFLIGTEYIYAFAYFNYKTFAINNPFLTRYSLSHTSIFHISYIHKPGHHDSILIFFT